MWIKEPGLHLRWWFGFCVIKSVLCITTTIKHLTQRQERNPFLSHRRWSQGWTGTWDLSVCGSGALVFWMRNVLQRPRSLNTKKLLEEVVEPLRGEPCQSTHYTWLLRAYHLITLGFCIQQVIVVTSQFPVPATCCHIFPSTIYFSYSILSTEQCYGSAWVTPQFF